MEKQLKTIDVNNYNVSLKDAIRCNNEVIRTAIENGEVERLKVLQVAKYLSEQAKAMEEIAKEDGKIYDECMNNGGKSFSKYGVDFQVREGSAKPDYKCSCDYMELIDKKMELDAEIKALEKKIEARINDGKEWHDSTGEVVEFKYVQTKTSIAVKTK